MPFGFSSLDYAVCAAAVLLAVVCLATRPQYLLFSLPTLLTIHFYVPLVTLVTPGRFVALLLGAWLIMRQRLDVPSFIRPWLIIYVISLGTAYAVAIILGDEVSRPHIRFLHYLSLMFIFLFVVAVAKSEAAIDAALWGLAMAGAIHCSYAIYQMIAFSSGLPFRAIPRGVDGSFDLATAGELLRVNGLTDEPKRLGYTLFAAALAWFYLAGRPRFSMKIRAVFRGAAVLCIVTSLLTMSASYLAAAAATIVLFAFSAHRMIGLAIFASVLAIATSHTFPEFSRSLFDRTQESISDRLAEVDVGLESERIYRQEFYALDYVFQNPSSIVLGLGMGRYNLVLFNEYGWEVGYGPDGVLIPLNSQVFEIGFDLGLVGICIWFIGSLLLLFRVGATDRQSFYLSCLLLFMSIQSILLANLPLAFFVLGICVARAALGSGNIRFELPPKPYRTTARGWVASA